MIDEDRSNGPARAAAHGGDVELFQRIARAIDAGWRERGDESFDPYDGLEGARVPAALKRRRATRLALVQWHKRVPVNTRRLFGVAPARNAYAVGQLVSASLKLERGGEIAPSPPPPVVERLAWLRSARVRGGWTYPFEVQTKTGHYGASSPNVISTVFAATAFLDAAEILHDDDALAVALEAAQFVARELARRGELGPYFAYLPDDDDLIHNANALAARLLVRAGALSDDPDLIRQGIDAVSTTMRAVRADGSLAYGEGRALDWVDGHHTGFVIDALRGIAAVRADAVPRAAIEAMAGFYRTRLFGSDGWPFQRPDRRYPIDAIAGAQGIQTFALLGPAYRDFAVRIARFMVGRMRGGSGHFLYHRARFHSKRVPYLRWADAPMCDALATLTVALTQGAA